MKRNRRQGSDPVVIAVVSMPPPITGQSTAARLLLEALDEAGVECLLIDTASPIGTTALRSRLRAVARTARSTVRMSLARPAGSEPVTAYFQLGQGPYSMLRDVPLLAAAAARRWRIVGHVHGGGWRHGFDRLPAPLRRIYLAGIRRADTVVVLTPRLTGMFDGLVEPTHLRVIGNGVERHVAERAQERPARWSPEPTVLFLANLLPEKGIDTVLDAARLASERSLPITFAIAGDALGAAGDHTWPSNCRYVGVVDGSRKEDLLSEAQILALPTRYWVEGEPISILEAFHFGLPVITCDQGGIADLVGNDNGGLIPADEPEALLDAIVANTVDRSRWEAVSRNNRAAAATDHSLDAHLRSMFDLLGVIR